MNLTCCSLNLSNLFCCFINKNILLTWYKFFWPFKFLCFKIIPVIERDEFSDQLIDKFFNDLEKESFLSDLIIKYANDKHHENKSWDVGFDLKKLLDIIWDENNYSFVSKKKMDKE